MRYALTLLGNGGMDVLDWMNFLHHTITYNLNVGSFLVCVELIQIQFLLIVALLQVENKGCDPQRIMLNLIFQKIV